MLIGTEVKTPLGLGIIIDANPQRNPRPQQGELQFHAMDVTVELEMGVFVFADWECMIVDGPADVVSRLGIPTKTEEETQA